MKLTQLKNTLIPVVVINKALTATSAKQLADAVTAGGSRCLEITLRTPEGLQAIKTLKQHCPDFIVGAGTVLTAEQAEQSLAAGADFLVSPGLSADTVKIAQANNRPMIPGVITPTEMQQAMALGLDLVKFFPAEQSGGAAMLKAFNAVYPHVQIMPTGGINLSNLADYTTLPNVFAVGGSWVCTADDIDKGNYEQITALLTEANSVFYK